MKKIVVLLVLCVGLSFTPTGTLRAQFVIAELIKLTVTKIIKAIDLEVQRIQNNTVWLQSAQKVMENSMSELHLKEITGWVQQQKDQYEKYYNELSQVKTIIADYHVVKEIVDKQTQLVNEYQRAWKLLQQDKHFNTDEINYMAQVYNGILQSSMQSSSQLVTVVGSLATQMNDAARMEIINQVAKKIDENYMDLQQFNTQNSLLSLARAKDMNDAVIVKWMYGIK